MFQRSEPATSRYRWLSNITDNEQQQRVRQMREIKFRGRSTVNSKHQGIKVGDWIYGSYIESGCDAPCIIFGDGEQCEIDRNTLGQYAGIQDKSGADVYEGEVYQMYRHCDTKGKHIKAQRMSWSPSGTGHFIGAGSVDLVMRVIHSRGSLCLFAPDGATGLIRDFRNLARPGESMKSIGNIHESPELLEG